MLAGMSDETPTAAPALPDLPEMDHTGGHKESQFHPLLGVEILRRMGRGQTIRQIAADPQMPSYPTIFRWRRMHPDFAEAYDQVRAALAQAAQNRDAARRAAKLAEREAQIAAGTRRRQPAGAGQKSTYERAIAFEVCRRVASGQALSAVAKARGMPSLKAIYTWLKRQPEFEALYLIAREEQAYWFEAELHHRAASTHWREGGGWVEVLDGKRGRLTPKKYRPEGRRRPKVDWVEAIPGLVFGDQSWRWPPGHFMCGVLEDD